MYSRISNAEKVCNKMYCSTINRPDDVVVSVHTEGKVVHLLLLLLLPLHDGQRGAQGAVRQFERRDANT